MRILIYRCGSGWGGIERRVLIDTTLKKIVDIDKIFSYMVRAKYPEQEIKHLFDVNLINDELDSFPSCYISEFNEDLSLLECFLDDCELTKKIQVAMDHQIDYMYILTKDGEIRKVWDTNYNITYPTNKTLCAKINKLMDYVSGVFSTIRSIGLDDVPGA